MRRTELRRTGPPARNVRLNRTGDLPKTSRRRRAQQHIRTHLADPWRDTPCWLAIPGLCTGTGQHWHELVGAGVGGSRTDPRNICWACDACNGGLEGLEERYVAGWKVRSHDAMEGDGGLVPADPHPLALASRKETT